jgi:Transmembrane secretion effector
MGIGAVVGALALPRVRQYLTREQLVGGATVLSTATAVVISLGPSAWVAGPALCAYGLAWIAINNALAVAAQTALPDWVRARRMSVYMVCV